MCVYFHYKIYGVHNYTLWKLSFVLLILSPVLFSLAIWFILIKSIVCMRVNHVDVHTLLLIMIPCIFAAAQNSQYYYNV